jgi:hypothetical protein
LCGRTIAEPVLISHERREAVDLGDLQRSWTEPLRDFYGSTA